MSSAIQLLARLQAHFRKPADSPEMQKIFASDFVRIMRRFTPELLDKLGKFAPQEFRFFPSIKELVDLADKLAPPKPYEKPRAKWANYGDAHHMLRGDWGVTAAEQGWINLLNEHYHRENREPSQGEVERMIRETIATDAEFAAVTNQFALIFIRAREARRQKFTLFATVEEAA